MGTFCTSSVRFWAVTTTSWSAGSVDGSLCSAATAIPPPASTADASGILAHLARILASFLLRLRVTDRPPLQLGAAESRAGYFLNGNLCALRASHPLASAVHLTSTQVPASLMPQSC